VDGFAQRLRLVHAGKEFQVRLPLVGEFQIENALVAAGLAIATGGDPGAVFAALEHLVGANGRLELAGLKNGAPIFIDYAHKPDALAKALEALRPAASARLVVVLGAGGDRDRGKRPLMGEVAAAKADRVIVTDDNPRSEEPAAIRAAILAAAPGATEIGDRREAIRTAIADLRPGDVLLVAGKGHETGQIIGDRTIPFSDHEAVATALKELAA
jgi:UDP-N-acetylmuramoyl-L-alanyl-D-glutamate--2,6-diaminopimelate ligase